EAETSGTPLIDTTRCEVAHIRSPDETLIRPPTLANGEFREASNNLWTDCRRVARCCNDYAATTHMANRWDRWSDRSRCKSPKRERRSTNFRSRISMIDRWCFHVRDEAVLSRAGAFIAAPSGARFAKEERHGLLRDR